MSSASAGLPTELLENTLSAMARDVAEKSYDPYLYTKAGAVALATDELMERFTFHLGTYVANAGYSPDICAEQAAMVSAVADRGPKTKIVALYVANRDSSPPCGRCLEIIRELGYASTKVSWQDLEGGITHSEYQLSDLLPFPSVPFAKEPDSWHYPNPEELHEETPTQEEGAASTREKAYCPYSNYQVGASVVTKLGNIYLGCNVENKIRGLTLCAERVAIARAIANEGPTMRIAKVFVASVDGGATPCGVCRQAINEFAPRSAQIICIDQNNTRISEHTHGSLLPNSFGPEQLGLVKPEDE